MLLSLPVWAMFIGWVAFFGRGLTLRDGLINLCCVLLGLVFGMGAALSIGALHPSLGVWALPCVVFGVAMIVVSLRSLPVMNNVVAYFLGLIPFFASQLTPSVDAFEQLGSASTLGSLAGWVAHKLQFRFSRHA